MPSKNNIKDMRDIRLLLGITFSLLVLLVEAQELPPSPVSDSGKNWVSSVTYDLNGNVISKGVNYFNTLGKGTQSQTWDALKDSIWAGQTFYDNLGRPALMTLSAPSSTIFGYREDFIRNSSNGNYSVSNFESNIDNPSSVSSNTPGTLGHYFSSNNTSNDYQDITSYPFTRTVYSRLNPGDTKKIIGGNKIGGHWKQAYSFNMVAGQELSRSNAFNSTSYNNDRITKTISRNIHGIETVSFINSEGHTLAAARSGNEDGSNTASFTNEVLIKEQGWVDFHIPQGCSTSATLISPSSSSSSGSGSSGSGSGGTGGGSGDGQDNYFDSAEFQTRVASFEAKNANTSKTQQAIKEDASNEFQRTEVIIGNNSLPSGYYYRVYDLIEEDVIMQVVPGTYIFPSYGMYRVELRYGISIYIPIIGTIHISYGVGDNPLLFNVETIDYGVEHCQNYYDFSLNTYDKSGRLLTSSQPLGTDIKNTFKYNSLGQLLETSSPDEGVTKYKYREDGQIRFSQNAKQLSLGMISFTDYDVLSRPVRSGVATEDFNTLNPDINTASNQLEELNYTVYDVPDTDFQEYLKKCELPEKEYRQTFLYGNVSKTYTQNPSTSTTWYSYDVYGRVKWLVQEVNGLDCLKTIDYTYDPITGQVTAIDYQRHNKAERFVHKYEYNLAAQLVAVSTSRDAIDYTINAKYYYTDTGALKRTELEENLQGIDYVYTLNGQLKAINSPLASGFKDPGNDNPSTNGFKSDIFGMIVDYHHQDYLRTGSHLQGLKNTSTSNQFNGNIGSVRWNNNTPTSSTNTDTFKYTYNKENWLTQANYGLSSVSGSTVQYTQNSDNDYQVSNITYDANGNIKTLKRNGVTDTGENNDMDEFTYHYGQGENQLKAVEDTNDNANPNRFNDLKNQYVEETVSGPFGDVTVPGQDNYTYNSIGQLETNLQDQISYEYDNAGLVTKINTFSDNNTGDWSSIYLEDFSTATIADAQSWSVESAIANINFGNYGVNQSFSHCGILANTYGNSLLLQSGFTIIGQTPTPMIGSRNLTVIPNKLHQLDLDVIAKQVEHARIRVDEFPDNNDPLPPISNLIGYTINVKTTSGSIIASTSYNTPNPSAITDPDMDDNSPFITACPLFYDQSNTLQFTPTTEAVVLEIVIDHDASIRTAVYIDNIQLQVASAPRLAFYYNDRGQRVRKEAYEGQDTYKTYYVRDAQGSTRAVYTHHISPLVRTRLKLDEFSVYGDKRLGVFYNEPYTREGGKYVYELTDHLGNVRSTIMKIGVTGALSVTNKTDYYPFGMPMPSRNLEGNYRYKFQGQEKDQETGMEAFELRLWDNRIGRWLTTDSKEVHASPYLGMGNNPITNIDPDGGEEYSNWYKALEALNLFSLDQGDWYKSDRKNDTDTWKNANLFNTLGGKTGEYEGFSQINDYYGWLIEELESRGHEVKWAKGAKGLTEKLSYLTKAQNDMDYGSLIGLLTELNEAIVDYAIPNFGQLLASKEPIKGEAAYNWDLALVKEEQRDIAGKVYNRWYNKPGIAIMTLMVYPEYPVMSEFGGIIPFGMFREFPNWDLANDWEIRVDIPMLMLYPRTHKPISLDPKYLNDKELLNEEYLNKVLKYHVN
jgi:RHS repeat-associated protein